MNLTTRSVSVAHWRIQTTYLRRRCAFVIKNATNLLCQIGLASHLLEAIGPGSDASHKSALAIDRRTSSDATTLLVNPVWDQNCNLRERGEELSELIPVLDATSSHGPTIGSHGSRSAMPDTTRIKAPGGLASMVSRVSAASNRAQIPKNTLG